MAGEINRKDVDHYGRRNSNKGSYKNRVFDGRRSTTDEYTGETLYYSSKGIGASKDMARHYTTETTANVDHVVPIDEMIKKYGGDVDVNDLKRITNSDYNLAITSESLNKSKGGMSNHEYLYKKFKAGDPESLTTTYNMLQKEISGKAAIKGDMAVTKVSNKISGVTKTESQNFKKISSKTASMTGNAVNAGSSAALMSLTVSSINNIVMVASNEKEISDAVRDVGKDTGGSFVAAAGITMTQETMKMVLEKNKNAALAKIATKNIPVAQISAMIMVGNSALRFINDEISAEECVTEILMNGLGTLAYSMGMAAGGPAGAVIASIVVGQISKTVIEYQQMIKVNKEKEKQLNRLIRESMVEIEKQRRNLVEWIEKDNEKWNENINAGFEKICMSSLDFDAEGLSEGLSLILNNFNQHARFQTMKDFNDFFNDADAVLNL